MRLSVTACDILDIFREGHRGPGARITIELLDSRLGSAPSVAAAVSELINAGYVIAPDAQTVELTAEGFDAIQRGSYRHEPA